MVTESSCSWPPRKMRAGKAVPSGIPTGSDHVGVGDDEPVGMPDGTRAAAPVTTLNSDQAPFYSGYQVAQLVVYLLKQCRHRYFSKNNTKLKTTFRQTPKSASAIASWLVCTI